MLQKKMGLITFSLAVALMLTLGATKAQAQEYIVLKTAQVVSFQTVKGTQDGTQAALRRVTDCYWIFQPSTQAFYFWPAEYIQANKQPLVGTYNFRDGKITVNASSLGTSYYSVTLNQIVGEITGDSLSNLQAKVDWTVGGGSAGAAGGGLFGNDSLGHYKITAALAQNR
jgi:hypothetical protein